MEKNGLKRKIVVRKILDKQIRLKLCPGDDGWIVVESPDLPGLVSQGKTLKEAIENGIDAAEGIIESEKVHIKDDSCHHKMHR